ncbi:hypothetical protein RclHR1_00680024 [Rhizophagus clarus]|uniref:F-box domain-containing protein n=1 Tax=Rhizophagus clarus TaxID=94130 RepID=A0A2Z6S9Z1_9GLOM|nr:hypothetical protein RclHR1_00680024 [Rhizophagus clarus]GES91006.1 hypothetical protein GLOIN_2v1876960 [Rhizophagus clarus]
MTTKPPMFNYASFCKDLSINAVNDQIRSLLFNNYNDNRSIIVSSSSSSKTFKKSDYILITKEIWKLFMNQITLKKFSFWRSPWSHMNYINFTFYPGAKNYLKNLSELNCSSDTSDISSDFFYQLSKICHNIRSLMINFEKHISKGLSDLIIVQKNLKYLSIIEPYMNCKDLTDLLSILPDTLIKLYLCYGEEHYIPLSFITKFTNLQELELSFNYNFTFRDFKKLQHVTFPQLQILKFECLCPTYEELINFLKNNGKNLKEFCTVENNNSINLAIAKFCPNLKKLSAGFRSNELETLRMVFNSCQYLESIKIMRCDDAFLYEIDALELIAKYSPKSVFELKLHYSDKLKSELLPEILESFFIMWSNRVPQRLLSLIIVDFDLNRFDPNSLDTKDENMAIIIGRRYAELGVIRTFKIIDFLED